MDTSEEQFQELLAHFIARGNKALASGSSIPPMSLALTSTGAVNVGLGIVGPELPLDVLTTTMEDSLREQASGGELVATCVAVPQGNGSSVALRLENDENFCALITIPIQSGQAPCLDTDGIEVDDGYVSVFPVIDS